MNSRPLGLEVISSASYIIMATIKRYTKWIQKWAKWYKG